MGGRWLREGAGVRVLNWVMWGVFVGPVFYGWFLGFLFSRPGTDGLMVWLMGWALSWELWVSGYVPAIGRVTGELAELGMVREMRLARHVYSVMVLQSVVCFLVVVVGLLACCFFQGLRGSFLWTRRFRVGGTFRDLLSLLMVLLMLCAVIAVVVYLHYFRGFLSSEINVFSRSRGLSKLSVFDLTPYAGIMLFVGNMCLNFVILLLGCILSSIFFPFGYVDE